MSKISSESTFVPAFILQAHTPRACSHRNGNRWMILTSLDTVIAFVACLLTLNIKFV